MRRYSWLLMVVVVVALVIITHRPSPDMPLPPTAQTVGTDIRIPVTLSVPDTSGEYWGLTRKADKTYVVTAYLDKHINHQFAAGTVVARDSSTTSYQTSGTISLDGTRYDASTIVVNSDGQSGYIDLVRAAGNNNQTTGS